MRTTTAIDDRPGADLGEAPAPPCFFAATIQGLDENGEKFESHVLLDGHLEGDLYLKLERRLELRLELWSSLFIVLRPTDPFDHSLPTLRVAVHGRVTRVEALPGGGQALRVSVVGYQPL